MKRFDQINVIPFIDIMLVLLTIVLTTATFISQGIMDIELPEAENTATQPHDKKAVEISIDAQTGYYLDGKAVSMQALFEQIDEIEKDTALVLIVDKAALFEKFVTVMDRLKVNQFEQLSVLTRDKQ